jgi:hypothetical protein
MLATALAALVVAGCPGPTFVVQQYAGPQRSQGSVATLRVNGGDGVRLIYLDEQDVRAPLESDARLHIERLPGRHTVTVRDAAAPSEPLTPVAFDAAPGTFYRVVFAGRRARVVEVDRSSDAAGRDVTFEPPPPPAATPAPPPASAPPPEAADAGAGDATPLPL